MSNREEITLNIGGKLSTGDVIGIAFNNYTNFGWFVEGGQYGSLKFITFGSVVAAVKQYDEFKKGTLSDWHAKKYANGIQFKTILKDYILKFNHIDNRAFKIHNPEEFFKDAGETEIKYQTGKQLLNDLKFPAK